VLLTLLLTISILALAKILEHAISKDDKRFQNIFVKGDRIINPIEGIKTRSKSKSEKELYTQVPLLVKIYKLLINELNNQIEDRKEDENAEDYEEYDDEEEEDADEEDSLNGNNDGDNDAYQRATNIEIDQDGENLNKYLNRYDRKLNFTFLNIF
jgi:importin-9